MKIFIVLDLLAPGDNRGTVFNRLVSLARCSDSTRHFFEFDDPEKADVFLFPTHGLDQAQILSIKEHPLVRLKPDKSFLWCDSDSPLPVLPGIYAALPSVLFDYKFHRTVFYLSKSNNAIKTTGVDIAVPYLASFQGSLSSNVRKKLAKLQTMSGRISINIVAPLWAGFTFGQGFADNTEPVKAYADLMNNSKFIICPKGNGVSSYRVFETLQAGRVPVIIADQYVPPVPLERAGTFILFIKENALNRMERYLLQQEKNFPVLAAHGKDVYSSNFSDARKIHYIGEMLTQILAQGGIKDQAGLMAYQQQALRAFERQRRINRFKIKLSVWLAAFKKS